MTQRERKEQAPKPRSRKGYDYDEVRDILYEFGFTAHIRTRGEEAKALISTLPAA